MEKISENKKKNKKILEEIFIQINEIDEDDKSVLLTTLTEADEELIRKSIIDIIKVFIN